MKLTDFLNSNTSKMNEIEKRFVEEVFYSYAGEDGLNYLDVQTPFEDFEYRKRKLDFTIRTNRYKYVIEIDGYSYHAEGAYRVTKEYFDDLINKQNDLIINDWQLIRFSYNQITTNPQECISVLRRLFKKDPQLNPYYLSKSGEIIPTFPQKNALESIEFNRNLGINKGISVLPTGMGKTILVALDAKRKKGRTLFIAHKNDILKDAFDKFEKVWPEASKGFFNSDEKNTDADVIFASKDSLYRDGNIDLFGTEDFEMIIIDEVHHSSCLTYKKIMEYFNPKYIHGITATPDRQDRADILELFDYNIYYEMTQTKAIEEGYLSGFIYYGLKDDIDYSKIKHNGIRYDVTDLGRKLNIPKRNKAILDKFNELIFDKKTLGFCVNIDHAITMQDFFNCHGVSAAAVHSDENRLSKVKKTQIISDFKAGLIQVLFSVDIFNEGVDFPDVEGLLFLRPTESKNIFIQQLGRGLRLSPYKNHVHVLDFIGNFKKANNIKEFIGIKDYVSPKIGNKFDVSEKSMLDWPLGCEVFFEQEVEEIFKKIEETEKDITKEDLIENYYSVRAVIKRKPSKDDINNEMISKYKLNEYRKIYENWNGFLASIGEATKASYHYPQGTHLGHIYYIVKTLGDGRVTNLISPEIYAPSKGQTVTKLGRQTRYKIWAGMELGFLYDDRNPSDEENNIETFTYLTKEGKILYQILKQYVNEEEFYEFKKPDDISWEMKLSEGEFNSFIKKLPIIEKEKLKNIFFKMDAVQQMLEYLTRINKNKKKFIKSEVYENYFSTPFIRDYFEINGIEEPTLEASKRRIPFILNILDAFSIIKLNRSDFEIISFPLHESFIQDKNLLKEIKKYLMGEEFNIQETKIIELKTLFGKDFLTNNYFLIKER